VPNATEWLPAPETPVLRPGDVHVWGADLDYQASAGPDYWEILSADERERAGRFHFDKDRNRFITARGTLRLLLSRYLEREPQAIEFIYGSRGKPSLKANPLNLQFNIAHSHALVLYAFTLRSEIGVDVEYLGRSVNGCEIASRYFSPQEAADLRSLPPTGQARGFFTCWTRKEAYVKATGEGIAFGLDQFSVTLRPDEPAALLETEFRPEEAALWTLFHLEPSTDYIGAVATRGSVDSLFCWFYPDNSPD